MTSMLNPKENTKQDYARRMDKVLEHIQNHLDDPLTLEELADVACFSPFHFHRIFSGMIGESVKAYIRRLRLERAANILMYDETPVTEIAFNAGFETHESFTRAFNSMFGVSPRGFRKAHSVSLDQKMTTYWKEITMDVKIVDMEDLNVAFIRHTGPYEECGKAWEALCNWAGPKNLIGPNARFLGLCHDDPQVTPEDKIRYDASIVLEHDVEATPPVSTKTIPGRRYAMAVHKGPYSDLAETYAQLCGQWIPQNGEVLDTQPSIEIYLNDCTITPPEKLLTEIYVPVK